MSLHNNILEELCIFNLEIKNVFVDPHFGLIRNGTEFASDIVFECNRPSVWAKIYCGINFFL